MGILLGLYATKNSEVGTSKPCEQLLRLIVNFIVNLIGQEDK